MITTAEDRIHKPWTEVSVFMGGVVSDLGVVSRLASIGLKDEGDI